MKTHLTDGELRAALDGELEPGPLHHLESCPSCQARQQQMQTGMSETYRRLAFLQPADDPAPAPRQAWAKFSQKVSQQKEISMNRSWFSRPLFRFTAAVIVMLGLILAFPGTRALAGELLNMFRVQQVAVVPVDFTGLEQLTGDGALGSQFTQLISDSLEVEREPGDPVAVDSPEQAADLAGFAVRVPQNVTPTQIFVTDGAAFSLEVDRVRAQALLDAAGRSDLVLPEAVDGADISVDIPSSVSVAYGECPQPNNDAPVREDRSYPDCVILVQMPSPTINAPASLDIDQLAQIGLEFTGMSAEEAAAFTGTVDWASTLVIPIPENASINKQVNVDGVTGTLIQKPTDRDPDDSEDDPRFALLWVKDGIIYAVSGLGTNVQQALDLANALP